MIPLDIVRIIVNTPLLYMEDDLLLEGLFPVLVDKIAVCGLDEYYLSGQKLQDFLQNMTITHSLKLFQLENSWD